MYSTISLLLKLDDCLLRDGIFFCLDPTTRPPIGSSLEDAKLQKINESVSELNDPRILENVQKNYLFIELGDLQHSLSEIESICLEIGAELSLIQLVPEDGYIEPAQNNHFVRVDRDKRIDIYLSDSEMDEICERFKGEGFGSAMLWIYSNYLDNKYPE